jgi:hypothetical protein
MKTTQVIRALLGISLGLLGMATLSSAVKADTVLDLNFPGIGNQIPIESFSFGPSPVMQLSVTRTTDIFSPVFFDATVTGTMFATASLDTYDSTISLTSPVSSFVMMDVLFTSIQHSGTESHPTETISMEFTSGSEVSNVPEPSTLALLGGGLLSLAMGRRRRTGR